MSKHQAFGYLVLWTTLAIISLLAQMTVLAIGFGLLAAGSLLVWLVKLARDVQIVRRARAAVTPPADQQAIVPPMTSAGSHRLFVPEPLDKQP